MLRGLSGELFLRREAGPVPLDDARAAALCDLARRVGRVGINDENLVGPRNGLTRGADVVRLVECDDGR